MEIMNKIMLFMSHPIADIIRPEIANYINYYDNDNISFVEFYFETYCDHEACDYYDNICDCCALHWDDCLCLCHRCGDAYKYCRTRCYNDMMS